MAKASSSFVGPYRLLNVVHTGHTCQLWQAFDDGNQRIVGLKLTLDEQGKDKEQLNLLKWEYNVGNCMDHPRIIKMYTFGIDRGMPYLAMEWFSAPNMKQWINSGTASIAYLLPKIIERAAEALSYFHKKGWVHRDIKPDNFLVTPEGEIKLIDFALSRKIPGTLTRFFSGRTKVQGTRSYMAPEQIRNAAPDPRADIYSFGCVLYELICGRPPFTGVNSNDLLNKHLHSSPPNLEALAGNILPEFGALTRKMLSKRPEQRPQSFDDFLVEFRRIRIYKNPPRPPDGDKTAQKPT